MQSKKIVQTIAISLVAYFSLCIVVIYAVPTFLQYWYAYRYDAERETFVLAKTINYFENTPRIYKENLSGFTNTNFNSYFTHGRDQWMNADVQSIYSYSNSSNVNFRVYGGNYAELVEKMSIFARNDIGRTLPATSTSTDISCSAISTTITAYELESAMVAVQYRSDVSSNEYKNIFTHEMGHGFGWYDHSNNTGDVMYPISSSSNINLTSRDINHIKQMYE